MANRIRSLLENSIDKSVGLVPAGHTEASRWGGYSYSAERTSQGLVFEECTGNNHVDDDYTTRIDIRGGEVDSVFIAETVDYRQTNVHGKDGLKFQGGIGQLNIVRLGKVAFSLFRGRSKLAEAPVRALPKSL